MSADNWRQCPRCLRNANDSRLKLKNDARKAYGTIPADEYLEMVSKANEDVDMDETLREDYYQGVDEDGVYEVTYRGSCTQCDYEFTYKHTEQTKA